MAEPAEKPVKQKAVFQARMKTPAQKQETPQETENPVAENVEQDEIKNPENPTDAENSDPKPVKQRAVFKARMKPVQGKTDEPSDE